MKALNIGVRILALMLEAGFLIVAAGLLLLAAHWLLESAAHGADSGELRTWTDVTGQHKVVAQFRDYKDGQVSLMKQDGKPVSVPISRLSEADQKDVKSRTREKRLGELKASHTTWRVKVVTYTTHQEPNFLTPHTYRATPGATVTVMTHGPFDGSHTVVDKHYVYEPVQGTLVSYQRTDVVIDVPGKGHVTFNAKNMGGEDAKFLAEFRKMERGE
jgi:hypothetical protein